MPQRSRLDLVIFMSLLLIIVGLLLALALAILRFKPQWLKFNRSTVDARQIAASATDYFVPSGAKVHVECLARSEGILLLIESEPLKRFRYSHIVEASLISHIEKVLDLHISRVFWRFPLPQGQPIAADADEPGPAAKDSGLTQGGHQVKPHPEYDVAEESWEQFEKAQQEEPTSPRVSGENAKEEPTQSTS